LVPSEVASMEVGSTRIPEAYDAYLHGLHLATTADTESDFRLMLAAFDQAIKLDPNYAAAYAHRARALVDLTLDSAGAGTSASLRQAAREAAERAVALAPDLAEAHSALHMVRAVGFLDFTGSKEEVDREIALAPGRPTAQDDLAWQEGWSGHYDAAIGAARRAVSLDPLNYRVRINLADQLSLARRAGEALIAAREAKAINSSGWEADGLISDSQLALGNITAARRTCESAAMARERGEQFYCLALVDCAAGELDKAKRELRQMIAVAGDSAAYSYAEIYAQLGDTDAAMQWLATAARLAAPDLQTLKENYKLDPLRKDPRFQAFERRFNFPP
jgi:tetratricopeptide (TPR) repeat protein